MDTRDNDAWGIRLRMIRNHLAETQTVFAERFGLNRHDIANYELGRGDIPTRVLAELDRMGVNLSWVLNALGDIYTLSNSQHMQVIND